MNKKLEYALIAMFGLIIVGASFFYSNENRNIITGFVVANPPERGMNVYTPPSITAQEIDNILYQYDSPAAGTGDIFYQKGVEYGIDPVYALVFFQHESSFGKAGHIKTYNTKNIGNIVCSKTYCANCVGRFCKFNTWEEGIEAWFKLIKNDINYRGMTLVEQILEKYCPRTECDTSGYIKFVETYVNKYSDKKVVAYLEGGITTDDSLVEIPEDSSGAYEFTPSFRVESEYNLYYYEIIIAQAKRLVENMDECIISKDTGETYTKTEIEINPDTGLPETIIKTYKKQETDIDKCLQTYVPEDWEMDCEAKDTDRNDDTFLFCVPLPYKIKIFNEETNKVEEVVPKVKFAMQFKKKILESIITECSGTKGGYSYDCVPQKMCDGEIDNTMEQCENNMFCCKTFSKPEVEKLSCNDLDGYKCVSSCSSGRIYRGAICSGPPMYPLVCCLSSEEKNS